MGVGLGNLKKVMMANLLSKDLKRIILDAKLTKGACGESQGNMIHSY